MLSFEALEELAWHQQCSDEDRIGVWHGSDARGRTSFSGRGAMWRSVWNGTTPPGGGWVPDGGQDLGLTMPCPPWWGAWRWYGRGWVGTRSWAGGWGRVPMSSARACVRARVRDASGGSSRTIREGYIP